MIRFRDTSNPDDGELQRWQVECYEETEGTVFPVGLAFVVVLKGQATLCYILVGDEWRRRGHGAAMIQACKDRWPGIIYTGAMNEKAAAFLTACGAANATVDEE